MTPDTSAWTVSVAQNAAIGSCTQRDMPFPMLTRFNATGALLRSGPEAVRVTRTSRSPLSARTMVDLAQTLLSTGVLTPAPTDSVVDEYGDLGVSRWEWVEASDSTPAETLRAVGESARTLNAVPVDWDSALGSTLPRLAETVPLAQSLLNRVAESGMIDPGVLFEWCGRLSPIVESFAGEEQPCVTHGDLRPNNTLMTNAGAVLVDWGSVSLAGWEWEHAKPFTAAMLFGGGQGVYEQFAYGYGADATTRPVFNELVSWRALLSTIACADKATFSPPHQFETVKRLRWWSTDTSRPPEIPWKDL